MLVISPCLLHSLSDQHFTTLQMKKLPNLHILDYVKENYAFALNFLPPRFPLFPTSGMALAFAPQFPRWFVCGEFLKVNTNKFLKPA